jgi:hypothetical protein
MVRVNIDAADNRFENFLRILRARIVSLLSAAAKPRVQFPALRRLLPIGNGIDPVLLAEEAMLLRNFAVVAEKFAVANCVGFQRILDTFDRRSGARPLAPRVLAGLASRGFARDASSPPGQSRLAVMRDELTRAFGLPAEPARALTTSGRSPAAAAGVREGGRCGGDVGGRRVIGSYKRPAWMLPAAIMR